MAVHQGEENLNDRRAQAIGASRPEGEGRTVAENLDYMALWNSSFIASNDFIEATMAFLQKRPPEFTGE